MNVVRTRSRKMLSRPQRAWQDASDNMSNCGAVQCTCRLYSVICTGMQLQHAEHDSRVQRHEVVTAWQTTSNQLRMQSACICIAVHEQLRLSDSNNQT